VELIEVYFLLLDGKILKTTPAGNRNQETRINSSCGQKHPISDTKNVTCTRVFVPPLDLLFFFSKTDKFQKSL